MIGIATALVILGASIAPFLTPWYVRFEQDRTNVAVLTGYASGDLDGIVARILGDLVLWQGDFTVPDASHDSLLDNGERAHMLDVRNVFTGLWVLVAASIGILVLAFRRARSAEARVAAWRAVRNGAGGLAVVIGVAGVFAVVAFDAAFEVFHRLFFSAGTYTFDPATSKLVQLFPDAFWSETAIIVGVGIIAVAVMTTWWAGRRATRIGAAA